MSEVATSMSSTATTNSWSKVLPIGFALFAMFFGAGNIVFPLAIGAQAGQNLLYAILGFLVFGVGAPFLGLYATSLFHGNYENFFNRLGKIPAFLVITFLMLIIGPLSAMPRTEVVTYQTIKPFLPYLNNVWFSVIYCGLVFILSYKETRFMNILGYVLSPVKLISFTALIILGITFAHGSVITNIPAKETLMDAVINGYNTMDLLAAFFFCSIAYTAIQRKAGTHASEHDVMTLTLKACLVGAACLSVIYIGFMSIAAFNANSLQGVNTEQTISAISNLVLGKYGSIFVGICITFACLATAMALAEVTGNYLYSQVFRKKIPKVICMLLVVAVMFAMTQLGFAGIMKIAVPILVVVYPALIVLCFVNILYKRYGFKYVKLPVAIALVASLIGNFGI